MSTPPAPQMPPIKCSEIDYLQAVDRPTSQILLHIARCQSCAKEVESYLTLHQKIQEAKPPTIPFPGLAERCQQQVNPSKEI